MTRNRVRETERNQNSLPFAARNHTDYLEHITDGFFVLDSGWLLRYLNPAAERIMGATRSELTGRNYWELFPACVGTITQTQFRRAACEQVPVEFETFYPPTQQWFAIKAYPAPDGDLSVFFRDVSAHKQAHLKLRAIYDGTREYIGLLSRDGTLLETNNASLEFAGSTRDEVVGRPFWATPWFALTPGAPELVREQVMRAAAGELRLFEATLLRPDGEFITFEISLHPVRDDSGEVHFIVPEGRDVGRRAAALKRDSFLLRLAEAIAPLNDTAEMQQVIARMVCEFIGADCCVYASLEGDGDSLVPKGVWDRHSLQNKTAEQALAQFDPECVRRLTALAPVMTTHPNDASTSLALAMSTPRQTFAVLLVNQLAPRRWKDQDIQILNLVLSRSREAIERARLTQELLTAERWLRLAQGSAGIGNFEWRIGSGELIWTPEMEDLYGLARNSFERNFDGWYKRVVREDGDRIMAAVSDCISRGQTEFTEEFRAIMPDGSLKWRRVQAQFIYAADGRPERLIGANFDIDEQKRSEAALRKQWQTFDSALSHIPDFVYTFDLRGRFTYMNRALLTLLGIELTQAVGRNFWDLNYPPELAERLQRQIQATAASRQSIRDETPFTSPAGETRYYEYVFVPVIGADGNVEAVAGSTRDITQRRNTEELILADRRRWRDLLLRAPASVSVLRGPELRYEWVNEGFSTFTGRTADEVLGLRMGEAIPEAVSQGYIERFHEVFRTGVPLSRSQTRLLIGKPVPRELYANFICMPTRDSQGNIDGIFIHVTDVTDLVKARQRVEESETRYRFLAESVPQLVWTCDSAGAVDYVSSQFATYLDVAAAEIARLGWAHFVHPEEKETVSARWALCLATGDPFQLELRLRRHANLQWRWFLADARRMEIEGRKPSWVGTFTDIHYQKENEVALRRANRELEEFAYVAGHDLQEPLRMVNIYTQMLLSIVSGFEPGTMRPDARTTMQRSAEFVQQGVSRMTTLIADLLEFSRVVHADPQAGGTADLTAAFLNAVSGLKTSIDESGAVISCLPLPAAAGDTAQLTHVFQNLISNAIKYRRPDIPPAVMVTAERSGGCVVVSVKDNGIGFDQQYADKIFGLFKRLHRDGYPGSGLGLAICKRIIEKFGGRIWAESLPGEGTTICFTLPESR